MTRQACKYEHGALWWRGSSDNYHYFTRDQFQRLHAIFSADHEAYAQEFARQIAACIRAYDADYEQEDAA